MTNLIDVIVNNWYLLVAAICVTAWAIYGIICFFKEPREQKIANVKEWLKYAVTEAEKALGSGTGQLKLHMVYDMAVKQFPWLISVVSFETFSNWVDEALEWMRMQLSSNINAQNYVEEK